MENLSSFLRKPISLKFIPKTEEIIIAYYNLNPSIFWGNTKYRGREYVFARQLLMFFQRHFTNQSLGKIGARYNKDHATVLHATKMVMNLCETDSNVKEEFMTILQSISTAYKKFTRNGYVCFKCGAGRNIRMIFEIDPNAADIPNDLPESCKGTCKKCGETIIVSKFKFKLTDYEYTMEAVSDRM